MKLDVVKLLENRDTRIALCSENIYFFAIYYFSQYFTHKSAPFHLLMYDDARFTRFRFLLWIMFRESAKTSIARIVVTHAICYGKKKNISWVGHDKEKAGKNLRAIANELQANKKILQDFGQLYYEDASAVDQKKTKPKQLSQFVTVNNIMVKVQTTQISTRGDLEQENRPDLYILDDIENDKTKRSIRVTQGIISFVEELMGGISSDANIIVLANRISSRGVVAYLEKQAKNNRDWRVLDVPIEDKHGITWQAKYCKTRKESEAINAKVVNPKLYVESLEAKRERLGSTRYAQEFLNRPTREGGQIVKETWFTDEVYYKRSRTHLDERGQWTIQIGDQNIKAVCFTAVDPALSQKETADDRAIVTGLVSEVRTQSDAGQHVRRFMYILDCRHGKWSLAEFTNQILAVRDKYKPQKIGVESNAVQELFRVNFQQYGLSTVALAPDGDKVRRLNRHVADIEFHHVFFPDDGASDDLINELIDFTGEAGGKDNLVDAFTYFMDMAKTKQSRVSLHTLG